jgi:hypothetical protein
MPKNTVSDPITDQEIAFAHLILSGTMNDRAAAEAVGLNPDTAAYTKAKPRVRAYMIEHRAAVNEKLVDQEADLSRPAVDGLRKLNLGRDQILTRLWELATLSHEVTKGSIAGQIKALAMIIAIEGLDPNRRLSSSAGTQPAGGEPGDSVAGTKASPPAPQVTHPEHAREPKPELDPKRANHMSSPNLDRNPPSLLNPFINPEKLNPFPAATDYVFDAVLTNANSHRLSFSPETGFSAQRRGRR